MFFFLKYNNIWKISGIEDFISGISFEVILIDDWWLLEMKIDTYYLWLILAWLIDFFIDIVIIEWIPAILTSKPTNWFIIISKFLFINCSTLLPWFFFYPRLKYLVELFYSRPSLLNTLWPTRCVQTVTGWRPR